MTQLILGIVIGFAVAFVLFRSRSGSANPVAYERQGKWKPEKEKNKERIMEYLEEKTRSTSSGQASIANNDVEELLGVSDATASRYLSELEAEGKLEERGEGSAIHYVESSNE